MSPYRSHEVPVAYPLPPPSYPASEQKQNNDFSSAPNYYVAAPPPVGYPVRDAPQQTSSYQTQSRGDGFLKGCCAGLCCWWILDCFVC